MTEFDLVILGSGPGGYIAAIRAAQLKLKVAIVEKEHLGGICLNWGCIPTKALLRSAEVLHNIKHSEEFGIETTGVKPNLDKMIKRSRNVSSQLSTGVAYLMKKNNITVIDGFGKLKNNTTVSVEKNDKTEDVKAKYIMLATGARPRSIDTFAIDNNLIWSYKDALLPKFQPKKLAVIGSGAIGTEFAYFYNSIGCEVTIFETMNRIVPVEDEDVSKFVQQSFEKSGMKILTGVSIKNTEKTKSKVKINYSHNGKDETGEFDAIISAVGVLPNTEGIGLEVAKVKLDEKKLVIVDSTLQTNVANIYAIGDIVQGPWLAHKASHEGVIAAENIAQKLGKYKIPHKHEINRTNIPACTYCHPQIASIGLTEKAAKEKYKDIKVGKCLLNSNGKAIALGDSNGFIKTIIDTKTGEILGCHMVGPEVTEMIQGFAIAKSAELTEEDLMNTIFPHPSISEAIHDSVLSAFNRALNS